MRIKTIVFLSLLFASTYSFAAQQCMKAVERTVYQGTLEGVGTVVMELGPNTERGSKPGEYIGRYFYPRYGVDIPLSGALKELVESVPYSPEQGKEQEESGTLWRGKITGGHFRGQRVDATTKRHFDLKRVARYDPDMTRPVQPVTKAISGGAGAYYAVIDMKQAPYEYLKLKGYAVPAGPIMKSKVSKGVAWRMYRDPRSKFKYPRLAQHPNPVVLEKINSLLEQDHWRMTLAALECGTMIYSDSPPPGAGGLGGFDDEYIDVSFLSATLMSVVVAGSTMCGGAHPNNHFNPFTLDLIRGEYLNWNRLFKAFQHNDAGYMELSPEMSSLIDQINEGHHEWIVDYDANAIHDENETGSKEYLELSKDYLVLHFDKPGYLALAASGLGHCCGAGLGVHAEIPLSALRKRKIMKPEARRYFPAVERN